MKVLSNSDLNGGICADEMEMGKTVRSWLVAIRNLFSNTPHIVRGAARSPSEPIHPEDWNRAYNFLRWHWRKQPATRKAGSGDGSSKVQNNEAEEVGYYFASRFMNML